MDEYRGVRVRLQGLLGIVRLSVQIDFGFGDAVVPSPVEISLPQILDFGSPELLGYTPDSAIAEKFQAIVELDLGNTSIKGFYDIWLLSRNLTFRGEVLAKPIKNHVCESPDFPAHSNAECSDRSVRWQ